MPDFMYLYTLAFGKKHYYVIVCIDEKVTQNHSIEQPFIECLVLFWFSVACQSIGFFFQKHSKGNEYIVKTLSISNK